MEDEVKINPETVICRFGNKNKSNKEKIINNIIQNTLTKKEFIEIGMMASVTNSTVLESKPRPSLVIFGNKKEHSIMIYSFYSLSKQNKIAIPMDNAFMDEKVEIHIENYLAYMSSLARILESFSNFEPYELEGILTRESAKLFSMLCSISSFLQSSRYILVIDKDPAKTVDTLNSLYYALVGIFKSTMKITDNISKMKTSDDKCKISIKRLCGVLSVIVDFIAIAANSENKTQYYFSLPVIFLNLRKELSLDNPVEMAKTLHAIESESNDRERIVFGKRRINKNSADDIVNTVRAAASIVVQHSNSSLKDSEEVDKADIVEALQDVYLINKYTNIFKDDGKDEIRQSILRKMEFALVEFNEED